MGKVKVLGGHFPEQSTSTDMFCNLISLKRQRDWFAKDYALMYLVSCEPVDQEVDKMSVVGGVTIGALLGGPIGAAIGGFLSGATNKNILFIAKFESGEEILAMTDINTFRKIRVHALKNGFGQAG